MAGFVRRSDICNDVVYHRIHLCSTSDATEDSSKNPMVDKVAFSNSAALEVAFKSTGRFLLAVTGNCP